MGSFVSVFVVLVVLLNSWTVCGQDLVVSLRSVDESFEVGSDVCLELEFRNNSAVSYVFYDSLAPKVRPLFPDVVLTFVVKTEDGAVLPWRGEEVEEALLGPIHRMKPVPSSFRSIPPGWFLGGPVCVNSGLFDYGLREPGVYRVTAVVEFRTATWLEEGKDLTVPADTASWLKSGSHQYSDGVFKSNTVTVSVVSPD